MTPAPLEQRPIEGRHFDAAGGTGVLLDQRIGEVAPAAAEGVERTKQGVALAEFQVCRPE